MEVEKSTFLMNETNKEIVKSVLFTMNFGSLRGARYKRYKRNLPHVRADKPRGTSIYPAVPVPELLHRAGFTIPGAILSNTWIYKCDPFSSQSIFANL